MKVREALVPDPRVLQREAPAREAAELLVKPNVESVLVADGAQLVGCVTTARIVSAVAAGSDLTVLTAGELADPDVTTVGPDALLEDAIHLMAEHGLERLAVVDDGRLLGILPRGTLVRRLAEDEPPPDPAEEEAQQQV